MSVNANIYPPVRGSLGSGSFYMLASTLSNPSQFYISVYLEGSGESFSQYNSPIFTPCFLQDGTNFVYGRCDDKNELTQFKYKDDIYGSPTFKTLEYQISGMDKSFNLTYTSDDTQPISGNFNVSLDFLSGYPNPTGTPSDPNGDRGNILVSFPYYSTTVFQAFPVGNPIDGISADFIFNYIQGKSTDIIEITDITDLVLLFFPTSYYFSSPQCSNTQVNTPSLDILIYHAYSLNTTQMKCDPGFVGLNTFCGWTTISNCSEGLFFNYCTSQENCGNCYGQCRSEDPCTIESRELINAKNPFFTCNVPPSPPPSPTPGSSNQKSFWDKYGHAITIASIIAVSLLFFAIFVAWLIPKKDIPPEKVRVVFLERDPDPKVVSG